jgi:hypothetical protein
MLIAVLAYIGQSIIFLNQGSYQSAGLIRIITIPLILGFLAVETVGFNNEVANERERLIFYTPNTMWSVVGVKLIKVLVMIVTISALIALLNIVTGYVTFYGKISKTISFYAPLWKENIILFSFLWNISLVIATVSLIYFFIAVKTGINSSWSVRIFIRFVLGVLLFFGFFKLMNTFTDIWPISISINNSIQLNRFTGIESEITFNSMSFLPMGVSGETKALFYSDSSKIVLGITPILYNIIVTLIFYPLTTIILKKKVFS